MHTLHFILINADSAAKAASRAEAAIVEWGNDNNWRSMGGIASEDGSDDIENHEDACFPLSFLDHQDGVPKKGTPFSRAVAYLHRQITEPMTFGNAPYSTHPDMHSAIDALADMLRGFNPDQDSSNDLWAIGRNLKHLAELMDSRGALALGEKIPQFYDWQFDHEGLTDLTEQSEGKRRYLVFLDMHS